MALIKGNVLIMVFENGDLNVTSPFNPMSVLKILGMAVTIVAEQELKKQQAQPEQSPLITPTGLPDKYKVQ